MRSPVSYEATDHLFELFLLAEDLEAFASTGLDDFLVLGGVETLFDGYTGVDFEVDG